MPVLDAALLRRTLTDFWKEFLELDQIPANAYFIELGGNSLLGTVLASRIEEDFGLRLGLEDIFANSLEELVELCVQESGRDEASRK
jgi:acyl carrier protein